jgi:hypothetical protein
MKVLDEYNDIEDAIKDWLNMIEEVDYVKKYGPMAEQFEKMDIIRVGEVILKYFGFDEESDGQRMKTFLIKDGSPFHAMVLNVPAPIRIFNSDSLTVPTMAELASYFSEEEMNVIKKYKQYFYIKS